MSSIDFQTGIAIISGIITILSFAIQIFIKFKYRIRKYLLLISIFASGVLASALLNLSVSFGVIMIILILFGLVAASRSSVLLKILAGVPSTLITKLALYNVFCESIQRVCLALVGDPIYDGNDLRVSIFSADWEKGKLILVGRFPLTTPLRIPEVEHSIGQGVAGVCAELGRPTNLEGLPKWEEDEREYINHLSENFNLSEQTIRNFNRKSRCFYNFPIAFRDNNELAHKIQFIVCIDSLQSIIGNEKMSSNNIQDAAFALAENNKELLIRDVIGF